METSTIQYLRVGDAERGDLADQLAEHFAAGRLSAGEFDTRVAAALRAKTRGELDALRRDLPATQHLPVSPSPTAQIDGAAERAHAHWLRRALAPWAVMAVVFVVIWAATGAQYFWPVWPILGWGIGVATARRASRRDPDGYLARASGRSLRCAGLR